MPKPIPEFVTHCCELLRAAGNISARPMMGGYMLKVGDAPLGVIAWDTLFLKVDAQTKAQFERAGGRPFRYEKDTGAFIEMSYWTAPDEAMESPGEMAHWARLAFAAGTRVAHAKAAKQSNVKTPASKPVKKAAKERVAA
jgi:DNA transformation protein and related proteins